MSKKIYGKFEINAYSLLPKENGENVKKALTKLTEASGLGHGGISYVWNQFCRNLVFKAQYNKTGIRDGQAKREKKKKVSLTDSVPAELGIYPSHIWARTKMVLNPLSKVIWLRRANFPSWVFSLSVSKKNGRPKISRFFRIEMWPDHWCFACCWDFVC